jgi:tetratricopeptide (TPR) repeat protein
VSSIIGDVKLTGSMITFRPQKVGVDSAGRVYAVAGGSTEGLIQLTAEGEFVRFFGSNRVKPNPAEIIYRYFLTRRQRQAREQFVPTEYSNLHIDPLNMVYTTTRNVREGQVKRLNALGNDILRGEGVGRGVYGDLVLTPRNSGRTAQFMSVCTDADENVYALDNATGKVFVYDRSGELLFIFGGKGDQIGLFADPHAVAVTDGGIFILDAGRATVTRYRLTDFGEKILLANGLYLQGEFQASLEPWMEVARMDATYTGAFWYIGWAYMGQKDYRKAMEYFKLGHGQDGYSRAFGELRDQWIRENFAVLFFCAAAVLAGLVIWVRLRRKRGGRRMQNA